MIVNFRNKGLEDLFIEGASKKINKRYYKAALMILDHLNMAIGPKDLVGVKDFHALHGKDDGRYSMHVNGNWCVTFSFDERGFIEIDFEDYH